MAANYASGGAAINVLARHCGARLTLVDMGIGPALEPAPGIIDRKVANGTRNFALEPAMSELQARRALQTGIELALRESKLGANLICTGEMGIGNTTSSSAIVACCTGESPAHVTGSGTGIDAATLQKKIDMVDLSLQRHAPNPADGIDMLAKIGGFEIGALAGLILGAACLRIPVLLDGFITTAAALVAAALAPQVVHGLIASHVSLEPGHAIALRKLALVPVLSLGMRLGEGSGAAIAIPVVQAACKLLNEMATFDEAGVSKAVQ
jgi:nicotinate-nucleotide--dimethylbenzimidazole phosphoribosyltransferase